MKEAIKQMKAIFAIKKDMTQIERQMWHADELLRIFLDNGYVVDNKQTGGPTYWTVRHPKKEYYILTYYNARASKEPSLWVIYGKHTDDRINVELTEKAIITLLTCVRESEKFSK